MSPNSTTELFETVLAGGFDPSPEAWTVTGSSSIYQTTQFPATPTKYHNRYLLMRVEASFGACSHAPEELPYEDAAKFSGMPLDQALRDARLPVRIAALDAYLGAAFPHAAHCSEAVDIPSGTPAQKAMRRDALIAELADFRPGQKVALIGVVHPLIAAIRERGGICLPCDLQLEATQWGEPVEKDMNVVLEQADSVICTGMTLGNGSFDPILTRARTKGIPLTVYAQTGSAIAARFVGRGVTGLVAEPFPFTQFSAGITTVYTYRPGSEATSCCND
jgi:hypothetical protein